MSSLEEILVDLGQRISDFEDSVSERNKDLEKVLNQILELVEKIESSWCGYWLKPYADLYFHKFQKPPAAALFDPQHIRLFGMPDGWMKIDYSQIEEIIEESFGFDLSQVREQMSEQIKQVSELRDYLCIELSLVKTQSKLTDEAKELEEIEKIEWGISIPYYIDYRRPKNFIGNLADLQRGFEIPPHIQYQANIVYFLSAISTVSDFIKQSRKLIRKIQIKESITQEQPNTINGIEDVAKICNTFHFVARQLRQRHDSRSTLTIEDEYDVQDLFHALLRMFFEDVRPEEWTPSYAGGSSRVDFLLRREKIVIEIKKTRNNLGAKEVGSQLLIDIARYQRHPDCKNLICFIYDPEGRIGNPKGLEDDLNDLSSEKINVITLIRPS